MAAAVEYFESDVVKLIKHITGFQENEENFRLCLQYVMSEFRFNRFLDVSKYEVQRIIDGIYEKLTVHSQKIKAETFLELTSKFFNSPVVKNHSEVDVGYAVLFFLLQLANHPTESSYTAPEISEQEKEEISNHFDWGKYLLEGEEIETSLDNYSEWSLSDEDLDDCEKEEDYKIQDDTNQMTKSFLSIKSLIPYKKLIKCSSRSWLKGNIMSQYWNESYTISDVPQTHRYNQLFNNWASYLEESGVTFVKTPKAVLNEYQILREILWVLQGVKQSFLFTFENNQFKVNNDICLSHVTENCLHILLKDVAHYSSIVLKLMTFIDDMIIFEDKENYSGNQTYKAYAAEISNYLNKWKIKLSSLEKKLIEQDDSYFLSSLMADLTDDFKIILFMEHIHAFGVELSENKSSWEKAIRLLNFLYENVDEADLTGCSSENWLQFLFHLFVKTFKPYASIMNDWINAGILEDPYKEFIITRENSIDSPDYKFWGSSVTFRTHAITNQQYCVANVSFFSHLFTHNLIKIGKSMELLRYLRKIDSKSYHKKNSGSRDSLYVSFLKNLIKLLSHENETGVSSCGIVTEESVALGLQPDSSSNNEKLLDYLETSDNYDPLLAINFQSLKNKIQHESDMADTDKEIKELLEQLNPPFLSPLQWSIQWALNEFIQDAYIETCTSLIDILQKEYDLKGCLSMMRNFFLMEAGDVMFSFYSELFDKIGFGEHWQNDFLLTVMLQDTIAVHYPQYSSKISVKYNSKIKCNRLIDLLEGLELHCKIPWPVDIVITDEIQKTYNSIFRFLLQIKWAKYTLDELRFKKLEMKIDGSENPFVKSDSVIVENSLSLTEFENIQRMYYIRMQLMHFVNGVHSYIMTQILHSTGIELEKNLQNATDLEQVITIHAEYVEFVHRCCLCHEKVTLVRKAVLWILNLVLEFQKKWNNKIQNVSIQDVSHIEEEFTKCCKFLGSFHGKGIVQNSFLDWLHTFVLQYSFTSTSNPIFSHN